MQAVALFNGVLGHVRIEDGLPSEGTRLRC